jgi:hypothetical protein
VCSLHFQKEFIIDEFPKITLTDGTVFQLKRKKPKLTPDAVPSKFEGYPSYRSRPIKTRKAPKRRYSVNAIFKTVYWYMTKLFLFTDRSIILSVRFEYGFKTFKNDE